MRVVMAIRHAVLLALLVLLVLHSSLDLSVLVQQNASLLWVVPQSGCNGIVDLGEYAEFIDQVLVDGGELLLVLQGSLLFLPLDTTVQVFIIGFFLDLFLSSLFSQVGIAGLVASDFLLDSFRGCLLLIC